MEGLQRSSETFRRSGSSGLVWEDRFASAGTEDHDKKKGDDRDETGAVGRIERSRSVGGGEGGGGVRYRAGKPPSPAMDPPSPKVSVCGFCSFFTKPPPLSKPSKPRRR